MTNPTDVPLVRRFSAVPKDSDTAEENAFSASWNPNNAKRWPDLMAEYRTVILADAGAGKTYEMSAQASNMQKQGKAAFFIRIEDIDDGFVDALEIGSASDFEVWKSSSTEAWFFLDSVDEARLVSPRAFEKAIKIFANRIRDAKHRAHIYISGRPYAWRFKTDHDLLEKLLQFVAPLAAPPGEANRSAAAQTAEESTTALALYWLAPLNTDDIRSFAIHRATPDVDDFINAIDRANLGVMAARPFDLEFVLSKWAKDQKLDNRLEILEYGIELQLTEANRDRADRQPLNLELAQAGARRLAAAITLTKLAGIRIPDASHERVGIDAAQVLPKWAPADVRALLERGIFDDAIYGAVRFRHREIRELLTAQWLRDLLKTGGSRHAIEALIFRERYGEQVITPTLRAILPWLILYDEPIRKRALAMHPEIAVEGGDVARLPVAERQRILKGIVERIAGDDGNRSSRDNAAIARIAQLDLANDTLALIGKHATNDDAIFFLGRLVWQGAMTNCVDALLPIAADPTRGKYARIAAARAVATVGGREKLADLWAVIAGCSAPLPRDLLEELICEATLDLSTVDLLLTSIERLPLVEDFVGSDLGAQLQRLVDQAASLPSRLAAPPIIKLIEGMNALLDRKPHIDYRDFQISNAHLWLIGPALHAVEHLVSTRDDASFGESATAILLKQPAVELWRGLAHEEYKTNLPSLVPEWQQLNDHLFWQGVTQERAARKQKNDERLIDYWAVISIDHYWRFDATSFERVIGYVPDRPLLDDKLVAFSLALRLHAPNDRPSDWLEQLELAAVSDVELSEMLANFLRPAVAEQAREMQWKNEQDKNLRETLNTHREQSRIEWISRLRTNPDAVCNPPSLKPGQLSPDQWQLLVEIEGAGIRTSRPQGVDWRALVPTFGDEVAQAFRRAAVSHWRAFVPGLGSEGVDTSIRPYTLDFGMVGLSLEAHETHNFPQHLSDSEVVHALRYLVWQLNGFPEWLETLYRASPHFGSKAIWTELAWELETSTQDKPMHYILHDLVYHAPWLHAELAPGILTWLRNHQAPNHDSLRHCLHIMIGGQVAPADLSKLAVGKIVSGAAGDQLPNWYALWVDTDPDAAIPALTVKVAQMAATDSSDFMQSVITSLMGERRGNGPSIGNYRTAHHLKSLYVLTHCHVRTVDDIDRAGKGIYEPTLRDNAQDARNRLFDLLKQIPGNETHSALAELAKTHPVPDQRRWMAAHARARAVADVDLEPWLPTQVSEFAAEMERTPTTHGQLFELGVSRLTDFKNWLENGNDSLAATYQKVGNEAEMRNVVTSWLNDKAHERYTCAQEPELANAQRPDIWLQHGKVTTPVPIELKLLDKGWTGPQLCERLRNQLAGDYGREATGGCGILLLIWSGSKPRRNWRIDGQTVDLESLAEALTKYWQSVSSNFPSVSAIKVITIDLTARAAKSAT